MRRSTILGLAAAAVLAAASVAAAPAIAEGLRWELGFKHDTPSWVRIPAGEGKTAISWYVTCTVENRTGAARKPAVRAVLLTDTKKEITDCGCPLTLKAVRVRTGNRDLVLAGDLHSGGIEDGKAVAAVATFGAVDDQAKRIELRVYGLVDPVSMVKGKQVNEVKYWQAKYERKGDEFGRTEDPWKCLSSGWVTEPVKDAK